jgi:hypothetical protein
MFHIFAYGNQIYNRRRLSSTSYVTEVGEVNYGTGVVCLSRVICHSCGRDGISLVGCLDR